MNVVPLSPNDSSIVPSAFTLVTLASGPPNVTHVIPPLKFYHHLEFPGYELYRIREIF